jgi:hypothetical protein
MEVLGRACSGPILTLQAPKETRGSMFHYGNLIARARARSPSPIHALIIQSQKLYNIGAVSVLLPQ